MPTQAQLSRLIAVVPAAQASQQAFGIPASVSLAQWATESTWGTSQLALQADNYFGLKCNMPSAETYVEMRTAEYEAGRKVMVLAKFVKYPNSSASFIGHALLISKAKRYQPAMAVKDDPFAFARQLQLCGYSTNPKYGEQLGALIRQNKLTQYDVHSTPLPAAETKAA